MIRTDYDFWTCPCGAAWRTPSVPHNSTCPNCGKHGWWQQFEEGEPYECADLIWIE
jgi:hypothetical protein